MKPYGADKYRSYDTMPEFKSARAYEGRVADEEIAEGIAEFEYAKCSNWACESFAEWVYIPSGTLRCGKCVPRGCSCQEYETDTCCEWEPLVYS